MAKFITTTKNTINLTDSGLGTWFKKATALEFKEWHIKTARSIVTNFQRQGLFPRDRKAYFVIVDKKKYGSKEEDVKPYGTTEFVTTEDFGKILTEVYLMIQKLSPKKTGQYLMSHFLTINGKYVPWQSAKDKGIRLGPKDKIQIINTVPYARKIEGSDIYSPGSFKKRKPQSAQAPEGVYRVIYAYLKKRYSKNMFIKYTFKQLDPEMKDKEVKVTRTATIKPSKKRPSGKLGTRLATPELKRQVYPTLILTPGMGVHRG
jgi:hypothetical protein